MIKALEQGATHRAIIEWPELTGTGQVDAIAEEVPVALIYNGISHAVMMASPVNLASFGLGFSLTEGIIDQPEQVYGIEVSLDKSSAEVSLTIATRQFERLKQMRRTLTGRSGCGLCGKESLDQIRRVMAPVSGQFVVTHNAIQRATTDLARHQPLQQQTGAVHGAAWCQLDGAIEAVCEDVGRHNALDKLIGSLWSDGRLQGPGFLLMSSRASFEIVQKAAKAGISVVATLSAPTSMAIDLATSAGMTLIGFARESRHLAYSHPYRLTEDHPEVSDD